jgi:GAF domain-containing protein
MTALPPDVVADLSRLVAELEQRLDSSFAAHDAAIAGQAATAQENAQLKAELGLARDRQNASAEILRTIAGMSGDAERSLYQIAETSAHLFGATSATIQIAEGDGWARTIRVGDTSKRVGAEVPIALLKIGGRNMPGTIVAENRQIHVPDLDNVDPAIADWPGLAPSRAAGTRTMCGSPLRREGNAFGVLIVYRAQLLPFTDEELTLQQSFADQAAIAIENARLFNESQAALERQTATAEILKVIAASPSDAQPVFEAIADSARRLLGGFSATVLRFLGDELHLVAFTPTNPAADEGLKASFPRSISEFPTFALVRNGETVQFPDSEAEHVPQLNKELARLRGFRSVLFTPLMNRGAPVGMISVTRVEPGAFAADHVQLLQTFADQAVIAIENARLFNETRQALERQTATAEVLKVMAGSPSDVQPVFEAVVASANRLIGGFSTAMFRFVDDQIHLSAFTPTDPAGDAVLQSSFPKPSAEFPPYHLVLNGAPAELVDTELEPAARDIARARGYRSMLFAPLMNESKAVGIVTVTRRAPGSFGEPHVRLLQMFAAQSVIAIENVRLFNETREALERQTATADILKVIASSPSDVQPVFEAIASSSKQLIGGFSATVFRFVDGVVHLVAYTPVSPAADQVLKGSFPRPTANLPFFDLAKRGEVVQEADSETNPDAALRELARARGFRSSLFSPLMSKETPIGLIVVTRKEPGTFAEHHVKLLQTFADQAVIAIENVRLFDEVQAKTADLSESLQHQTATSDVLQAIGSSMADAQPAFDRILDGSMRLFNCKGGAIFLAPPDGLLHLAGSRGFGSGAMNHLYPRPIGETTAAAIIGERQQRYVPDVLNGTDVSPSLLRTAETIGNFSVVMTPMVWEGRGVGMISVTRDPNAGFNDKELGLLKTFADQAVIAIENARLFNEVQAKTRDLSASLDDLRTAQDRLVQTEKLASLGQLTAGIAHEIKNPLNFVNNFAALSAELTDELNDVLKPAALSDQTRGEVDELTGLLKDNLQKVVQHGKRADSIVKNMLLHSREGSGDHRPTDINALVDESLNLAYHGARAEKPNFNVTLQRDFDPAAGMLEVFPQEITRVFLNLVSNGFYAVAKRKDANAEPGFDPVLSATTRNLGDAVEIRIRDNGTGIPPGVRDKMFNPFFTTKPAGEGTGLGLSMSHDIVVKQHGGSIDVETEPGQFTEFRIVLPRTSSPANKNRGQT